MKTGQCLNRVNVSGMNYLLAGVEGLSCVSSSLGGPLAAVALQRSWLSPRSSNVKDSQSHPGTTAGRRDEPPGGFVCLCDRQQSDY